MPDEPLYNPQIERLEKINDDLSLIQLKDGFLFGTDSVALCDTVSGTYQTAVDLGTGSGIIPLLLLARGRMERAIGIEIQPVYAALARRNAALNGLSQRLEIVEGDIRSPRNWRMENGTSLAGMKVDLVVSNPPYIKLGSGLQSPTAHRDIARTEVCCELRDVCRCASVLLDTGGDFVIVHRADRLTALLCTLREFSLEPKELRIFVAEPDKPASLAVVKAKKDAGEELKVYIKTL